MQRVRSLDGADEDAPYGADIFTSKQFSLRNPTNKAALSALRTAPQPGQ